MLGLVASHPVFNSGPIQAMSYFKIILSVLAAMSLALFGPGIWLTLREFGSSKTVGLGAVAGGLTEALYSPLFWVVLILFFALFFGASRLGNKALRVLLFWIPTVFTSALGLLIGALFVYAITRYRHP
jgi:hypothetical protein